MIEAYKNFWANYANFKGRAKRGDYWWVVLANIIIGTILGLFGKKGIEIASIYSLIILIPSLSLVVRRLHDINKSGWTYLLILIPIVGGIVMLVLLCTDSVDENNRYDEITTSAETM